MWMPYVPQLHLREFGLEIIPCLLVETHDFFPKKSCCFPSIELTGDFKGLSSEVYDTLCPPPPREPLPFPESDSTQEDGCICAFCKINYSHSKATNLVTPQTPAFWIDESCATVVVYQSSECFYCVFIDRDDAIEPPDESHHRSPHCRKAPDGMGQETHRNSSLKHIPLKDKSDQPVVNQGSVV